MSNVLGFGGQTTLPLAPERVLLAAAEKEFGRVLVVAENDDGSLYLAGSHSEIGDNVLMLELAKQVFLGMMDSSG